jgi:plastocyanin
MLRLAPLLGLSFVALAACGDDGGDDGTTDGVTVDAPSGARVTTVTCPASPAATIATNTAGTMYVPDAATINAGQVVRFDLGSTHDVAPADNTQDSGLLVPLGGDVCLQFSTAGTYRFKCTPHGFTGTITVQ